MTYKRVFWGVILVLIGVLVLLKNLDMIHFSWFAFWRLWPLLLILWGISVLPIKDWIKLSVTFLAIAATFWIASESGNLKMGPWEKSDHYSWGWDDWDGTDEGLQGRETQVIREKMDSSIRFAVLKMTAAAGSFDIRGKTDDLLFFRRSGMVGQYEMTRQMEGETCTLNFQIREKNITSSNDGNRVVMRLNALPVWDLDLDVGAAEIDFDMSEYQVKNVDIDGGAASMKLRFGNMAPEVNIDIDAGASSITLYIPKDAGCKVDMDTFVTGKTLDGFERLSRGNYQTPGYDTASVRFFVKLDAAVSDLKIERY